MLTWDETIIVQQREQIQDLEKRLLVLAYALDSIASAMESRQPYEKEVEKKAKLALEGYYPDGTFYKDK